MKFNLKIISLLLIIFFISISVTYADDGQINNNINENINVTIDNSITDNSNNNINDPEINNSTTRVKGFYELQQQIWKSSSGDTIELDSDYIHDGKRNMISIDRNIILEGNGHILDGNTSAIFYITGISNVVIKNTVFINGERSCGGAIIADTGSDYLNITNCTFKNNKATTSNVGGAIYIKASYSAITNSYFENNLAQSSGGAIRLEGDSHIISNNIFTANEAKGNLGGAINALGHNIQIINNTFTQNIAGRDGGAINIEGTTVASIGTGNIISNNIFDSNKAAGSSEGSYGGAISISGQNCEISYNKFTKNHADTLGGAIRWNGMTSNSGKIIENQFEGNDARSGGAIYVAGSGITISKNTFNNHKSTVGAGGTINIKGNSATISNNNITNSHAKTSGGALYVEGKSNKLTNNIISSCSAGDNAGAAYLTGASATVTGNHFISNTAGKLAGALEIKSSSANIKNNEFSGNVAKSSGGAAYIEGAKITLTSNTFNKNKAGSQSVGGAVRWSGNDATITNNKFVGNTAKVGFAIYGNGEIKKFSGNTYSPKKTNTERWEKISVKLTTPTKTFKKAAKTKKIIITLKTVKGKILNKKKITLKVNKKTYTATTNSKGQATINVKLTKKGSYKYTVKFAGDINYNALSKTGTVKIK